MQATTGALRSPLDLVQLTPLMTRTQGVADIAIGMIDGPVQMSHPDLAKENLHAVNGTLSPACAQTNDSACGHGTFVAGILSARRGSSAPAICPDCTLLVRPIFADESDVESHRGEHAGTMPHATPKELAQAIIDCVRGGARIINLSVALTYPSFQQQADLEQAISYANDRGTLIVAAAGNQAVVGSSAITRHPSVIPIAAASLSGAPLTSSNLSSSMAKRGFSAPGLDIQSLAPGGGFTRRTGTSAATPFITGSIALAWSLAPRASARQVRLALVSGSHRHRLVPPLLDAWSFYLRLKSITEGTLRSRVMS
jgi:subtilisin family serine protease